MGRLVWNETGKRRFETGVDRAVLYVGSKPGVVWNGIVGVKEHSEGGELNRYYLDGVNYLNDISLESYKGSLEAYYSPVEFDECDGTRQIKAGYLAHYQPRSTFDLVYRTLVGNDTEGLEHGYQLHFLYNVLASPSEQDISTLTEKPSATTMSWDLSATAIKTPYGFPTAHFSIDTTKFPYWMIKKIEDVVYGTERTDPRMMYPEEIMRIYEDNLRFILHYYPDGRFTLEAPDGVVTENPNGSWYVDEVAAHYISPDRYVIDMVDENETESAGVNLISPKLTILDTFQRTGDIIGSKYPNNGAVWQGTFGIFSSNQDQLVQTNDAPGFVWVDNGQINTRFTSTVDLVTEKTGKLQQLRYRIVSQENLGLPGLFVYATINASVGLPDLGVYKVFNGASTKILGLDVEGFNKLGLVSNSSVIQKVKFVLELRGTALSVSFNRPSGEPVTLSHTLAQSEVDAFGTLSGIAAVSGQMAPGIRTSSIMIERI